MIEQSKTPRTDMAEIIESLKKRINESTKLQSLLYDINLLPEQLRDDDLWRWGYVESIVLHFEATETENADLRRQVEQWKSRASLYDLEHALRLATATQFEQSENRLAAAQAEIEGLQRKIGALEQVANQAEAQCKVLNQSAQAENAALREDSERYRWLRQMVFDDSIIVQPDRMLHGEELDAAIDAARKEQP